MVARVRLGQKVLTIPMSRLAGRFEKLFSATIPFRSVLFFGPQRLL